MHLRKRTIAGIAAVAVIFVGAFAEAMFSEGGVGGLARGWDAIESFVRPSPSKPRGRSAETPRTTRWTMPDQLASVGDGSPGRGRGPKPNLKTLDQLKAGDSDPMSFDAWLEGEVDPVLEGLLGEASASGGKDRSSRGGGRGQRSGPLGADSSSENGGFLAAAMRDSQLSPVVLAAMGGAGGSGGFFVGVPGFPGTSSAFQSELVATPLPASALLVLPVLGALVGRRFRASAAR